MPSFAYAFARCVSTVRSDRKSRFAIAAAVSPRDASRATSRSRWLSASVPRVARRLGRCFRPERKISTGVRIDSTSPSHARWSSPGNSTYVAPGMRSAMYLAWPTSIHRSPARWRISVGTPILGSRSRRSICVFMRITACAMAGLAAIRRYRAHHCRWRSSSNGLGCPSSHHSPVAHARPMLPRNPSSSAARRPQG